MAENPKRFKFRGFISFTLTLSFILISVTGLVLYIVPPGRVAHWIQWRLWGMTKDQWAAVHTLFSFIFIVVAGIHLYYNWRIFTGYIVARARTGLNMKYELAASIVFTAAVFAGTLLELPPFSTTMNFGESIKESWETGTDVAPAPHTELMTLTDVVDDLGMRIDRMLEKLERNGVTVEDPSMTLKEIAEQNKTSPSELYKIIQRRGEGAR